MGVWASGLEILSKRTGFHTLTTTRRTAVVVETPKKWKVENATLNQSCKFYYRNVQTHMYTMFVCTTANKKNNDDNDNEPN